MYVNIVFIQVIIVLKVSVKPFQTANKNSGDQNGNETLKIRSLALSLQTVKNLI